MNRLNKLLLNFIIFIFIFLMAPGSANAIRLEWLFQSRNDHVIWEVAFYLTFQGGSTLGGGDKKWWWTWVDNKQSVDNWIKGGKIPNIQNYGRSPYGIVWSTACVDPAAKAALFYNPLSGDAYYKTDWINISTRNSNDLAEIRKLQSDYRMDFPGFGSRRTGCDWPQPACKPNFTTCGTNRCGSRYWDGCKYVDCKGCPAGETCTDPNGQGSCVVRRGCNNNGQCVIKQGGSYASNNTNCSGACDGPISGTVYIDGKVNGKENNNFDQGEGYTDGVRVRRGSNDYRNPNPNYSYTGLATGSNYDIRVVDWNSNRLNLESSNPRNVRVPNNNVDFRFSFKKYRVFGKVFWDPTPQNHNSGDEVAYINKPNPPKIPGKIVKICVVGQDCDDSDAGGKNAGEYSIPGIPTNLSPSGAGYTVKLSGARSVHTVEDNNRAINITGGNKEVNFYISNRGQPEYTIGGIVYLDDGDNRLDPGNGPNKDKPYKQTQVTITTDEDRTGKTNKGTGRYSIPGNPAGEYTVGIASGLASGFEIVPGLGSRDVTVGPDKPNINFLVRKANIADPSDSITGQIFFDISGDGIKNGSDYYLTNWSGQRITLIPGTTKTGPDDSDGIYTFDNLTGTNYRVRINNPPGVGFRRTYPSSNTYTISNLGTASCSVSPSGTEAECSATGSVSNVDFGITSSAIPQAPWYQGVGGYMRDDKGSSVSIPAGKFFSLKGSEDTPSLPSLASPGVVFNFNVNRISSKGWRVTNSAYRPGVIKTSYEYIKDALKKGKATQVNLFGSPTAPCGNGASPNCNLDKDLPGGYYFINKNISLKTKTNTFKSGVDYVFLINGNLNIDSDLDVPQGTTAMFVASGDITVDKNNVNHIEGIFSSDGKFIADSIGADDDSQLVIEGSVIANAIKSKASGKYFENKRDLGSDNNTIPSVKIIYRPDFVLNAPDLIRYSNYSFHEVAPSGQ